MPNVLTVRDRDELAGRRVDDSQGNVRDRDAERLVILIHGYQNSEDKAGGSYKKFRKLVRSVALGGERGAGAIWEFHWPGNHTLWPVSVFGYPVRIGAARIAGDLLARRWLADRGSHQSVVLVAHSLGCRVALETVWAILDEQQRGNYDGARIEAVFLLAAAVPTRLCAPGMAFANRYPDSKDHVFFSQNDITLRFTFNPGQYVGSERGVAVGRAGEPRSRWTTRHDTRLSHGGYWKSQSVAAKVCELLDALDRRAIEDRQLAMAEVIDYAPSIEPRHLPERYPPIRFV